MDVGVGESADFAAFQHYREHGGENFYYAAAKQNAFSSAFAYLDKQGHAHKFFYACFCFGNSFSYFSLSTIVDNASVFYTSYRRVLPSRSSVCGIIAFGRA